MMLKYYFKRNLETILHVIVWTPYFMLMEFGLGTYWNQHEIHFIRLFFLTLPVIFYINSRWLIPKYLRVKDWIGYTWRVLLVLFSVEMVRAFVIGFFEYDVLLLGFSETFDLNPLVNRSLFSFSSLGFILSFGYNFTKDWILNIGVIDRLKAEKLEMELAFLKSQVDPHFLFNTLNNIYGLALEEKSEATADAIVKLSTLMRYNLHDSQSDFLKLSKEIDYINKYVALQRLRSTTQTQILLKVSIGEEESNEYKIVPMLLIGFIENAFKYSMTPIEEVMVQIYLKIEEQNLVLILENSIASQRQEDHSHGIGLMNIQKRLDLLYPNTYNLISKVTDDNHYYIELKLPLNS